MRRIVILMPLVVILLSCGLFSGGETPVASIEGTAEQADSPTAQVGEPAQVPPPTGDGPPTSSAASYIPAVPFHGDTLVEEKIISSTIVGRATMTSFSSEVVVDADGRYSAVLKFSLNVSEYLKGTGPSSIVAVWVDGRSYNTNAEANDAKADILAERDDQWDDREAIIFLLDGFSGFGTLLDGQLQLPNHFLLYVGDPYSPDDFYSLHSRRNKIWLPAISGAGSTDDDQDFLLDVPTPQDSTAPTITLGNLKTRITEVTAEINGGDGSEEYKECVREKYRDMRMIRYFREEKNKDAYSEFGTESDLASGQPINTVAYQRQNGGIYPSQKPRTWLAGRDAALFSVVQGEPTPVDLDRDGSFTAGTDGIEFAETFATMRPLPAGEYEIDRKEVWSRYLTCGYILSFDWTVTVTAPEDTLHEAFFDPVADGSTVAADSTNGVLKPTTFTDSNGASATIERIAWEAPSTGSGQAGRVKLELSPHDPHDGIAGHIVDFIALDGSVPLSLIADAATVDATDNTLSWTVASQPWESGDKLMLRIREAPDCSTGAVSNPSANPGLVRDCQILLVAKDTLRGAGALNWDVSSAMATWEGVTTGGSPSRVTRLELANEGLDGSIPGDLGRLSELTHLILSGNSLTGDIPRELIWLSNLEELRLSGNSLTGCIPLALMSVATNDLSSLNLLYCRPPAPGNLSAGTSGETSVPLSWDSVSSAGRYQRISAAPKPQAASRTTAPRRRPNTGLKTRERVGLPTLKIVGDGSR